MKKSVLLLLVAMFALAGCQDKPKTEAPVKPQVADAMPAGHPPVGHPPVGAAQGNPHAGMKAEELPVGISTKKAVVVQATDADVYTYIEAKGEDGKTVWLALPKISIAKGAKFEYQDNIPPMQNFVSKTMKRTFESIYFVQGIRIIK